MRSQYGTHSLLRANVAPGAYRNVYIVVELDDLAEYADPLVEVGEVERVSQLVDQGVLVRLLRFSRRALGLAMRPLS